MAKNKKDILIDWLQDAYSMEKTLTSDLRGAQKMFADEPEIKNKISEHLRTTENHADMVKSCLERNGADVSLIKDTAASVAGMIKSVTPKLASDKKVKSAIADHATEHLEMASYLAIETLAEDLGDTQTASICQNIIEDEKEMAKNLEQDLPKVVREYVAKETM